MDETEKDEVTRRIEVEAPPAEVWRSLTEPERLAGWLGDDVEIALEPGGDLALRTDDDERRVGWVEEVEEPSRLAFWWSVDDGESTRVELDLEETEAGGTRVRVTESRPLLRLERRLSEAGRGGGAARGPTALAVA